MKSKYQENQIKQNKKQENQKDKKQEKPDCRTAAKPLSRGGCLRRLQMDRQEL